MDSANTLSAVETRRALEQAERDLGPADRTLARLVNRLAWICDNQDEFAEAATLFERLLVIKEGIFGPEYPAIVKTLYKLAWQYRGLVEQARRATV